MVFYRRKLPHWQPPGKALFVTWRLRGSLPASFRNTRLRTEQPPQALDPFPNSRFVAEDRRLDQARQGPAWLKDGRVAKVMQEALQYGESKLGLYGLYAYVIKANHVHVLMKPNVPLERITRTIKGFTARNANQILGRTGQPFWQEESYDHWVRSEEEFSRIAAYIEHNPVNAGLVKRPQDWLYSSAHR